MHTNIQEFLKNEKLPKFLTKHKKLANITKVSKVFPSIGLPNCSETCKFDNSDLAKNTASILVEHIVYNILYCKFSDREYEARFLGKSKLDKITYWKTISNSIRECNYATSYVVVNNGKISIKLSDDIIDNTNKVIFRKDESLFRVYNKICEISKSEKLGIKFPKLETIKEFKQFSTENIPVKDYQIVFSSNGQEGLWDIATMSMRGIQSCQSWRGKFKTQLVGSLVDPCVGIMYLTSGKSINDLGSKMIKRSVVRYAIHGETKKPIIIIDRMYPEYDIKVGKLFYDFIKNKTGNKLDVFAYPFKNGDYKIIGKTYLPHHSVRESLCKRTRSYMDTPIIDCETFKKSVEKSQLEINIHNRKVRFDNAMIIPTECFDEIKRTYLPSITKNDNIKAGIKLIIRSPYIIPFIRDYYYDIARNIVENIQHHTINSSDEYLKQLCFSFLAKKHTKQITTTFVRSINKYFNLPKEQRINSEILNKLLVPAQTLVSNNVKLQLKELLTTKPVVAKLS
jgi:hypothetical protein